MKQMAHFGDPCIHCNIAHDDFPVGPCQGDHSKAKIIRFGLARQAWQNPVTQCDDVVILMSSGEMFRESHHPSEHWRYSERFADAKSVGRDEILTTEAAYLRRLASLSTPVEQEKRS